MNKTKRNEGREKKLKFKSQYKNTFIFDWQNEKKSISYMSYGLNLKYLQYSRSLQSEQKYPKVARA